MQDDYRRFKGHRLNWKLMVAWVAMWLCFLAAFILSVHPATSVGN